MRTSEKITIAFYYFLFIGIFLWGVKNKDWFFVLASLVGGGALTFGVLLLTRIKRNKV